MKILYSADQVAQRIDEMAQEIIVRYPDDKPLFVCLLRGAVPFTSQLMTAITRHNPTFYPEVAYLQTSTYGADRTPGEASVYSSIVLDDCLDHGVTYAKVKQFLIDNDAASIKLVVLVDKDTARKSVETPLLAGFTTPDIWLVGMGMDDASIAPEAERWADYIGNAS
jgi:hypoxanthine phosphoribosyltransferase